MSEKSIYKNLYASWRRFFIVLLSIIGWTYTCFAQEQQPDTFKPCGKPEVLIFADFKTGLDHANKISGFDLTRAYLGYKFQATPTLSARVTLDVANESTINRIARFKYAMVSWAYKGWTVNFGLVGLVEFNLQEKFWGYRYLAKSFQDEYSMGYSADMGLIAKYKFTDQIETDLSITNGEGYKKLNKNNSNRYGLGLTTKPLDELTLRVYADIYVNDPDLHIPLTEEDTATYTHQKTLALFAGYKHKRFSIGVEYNYQANKTFIEGCDYYGYSLYTTVPLWKGFKLFGRFDYIDTKTPIGLSYDWENTADRNLLIGGIEYCPVRYIKVAPNYKFVTLHSGNVLQYIYLNVEFCW